MEGEVTGREKPGAIPSVLINAGIEHVEGRGGLATGTGIYFLRLLLWGIRNLAEGVGECLCVLVSEVNGEDMRVTERQ